MGKTYRTVGPLSFSRNAALVQAAGEAIDALRAKHGGVCPPEAYVERARPKDSATHETLPWDDAVLAEQKRRELAAVITRYVVVDVVTIPSEKQSPAYLCPNVSVALMDDDGNEVARGSVAAPVVVERADFTRQAEARVQANVLGDLENHRYLPWARYMLDCHAQYMREQEAKARLGAAPAVEVVELTAAG